MINSEVTKFASFLGPDNDEDSYENHSTDQSKVSTTNKIRASPRLGRASRGDKPEKMVKLN